MCEQNQGREILQEAIDQGMTLVSIARRSVTIPTMRLKKFMRHEIDLYPEELVKIEKLLKADS